MGDRREIPLDREQTVVEVALPGVDCLAGDSLAVELLAEALNGMASPLFRKVREEQALAYTTGMRMASGFQTGLLTFFAVTTPEGMDPAIRLLHAEIDRLGSEGLTEKEFSEARDGAVFQLERRFADSASALATAVLDCYYGKSADDTRLDLERLRQLTREEVNAVLRRRLGAAVRQTVVAGRLR